jgi:alpha-L-fucosidase
VKAFTVEALVDGSWKEIASGTTIGYKRILRFPSLRAVKLRVNITDSKACPLISNIGIYNAPQILTSPGIIRNQAGEINITAADRESVIYYTLDGSLPLPTAKKYTGPFQTEGKLEIRAVAYDLTTGKSSPGGHEKFDIPRKDWSIPGVVDEKAKLMLDGNPATAWHQRAGVKMPVDIVIDFGKEEAIEGFRYLPDQGLWNPGIITNYQFYVSNDSLAWKLVDEGEFSNIRNNPLWQVKKFPTEKVRYIKLRALKNTEGNDNTGYAELDIITN